MGQGQMSEDRDKHDQAGKGSKDGLGHHVGKGVEGRRAQMRSGMSQHIPDEVREKIKRGDKGKTDKGKGGRKK